jgi:fermentation-respiration switch protein FrsA (DUF1100 family)
MIGLLVEEKSRSAGPRGARLKFEGNSIEEARDMARRTRQIVIACCCLVVALAGGLFISFGSANGEDPRSQSIDEKLLFFPTKYPAGQWSPSDLNFEDVFFASADGTRLHGWYCPAEDSRAALLICHGNAGHLADRVQWVRYLQQRLRVSVFIFDYRGYGRSEGRPTVRGAIQDATAARAELCRLADVPDQEVMLMGESLGGAVAVQLAADSPPRGLILQSTFSSLRDVARVHYPLLAWLVPHDKLASAEQIVRYRGPLLQSHGDRDQTIPPELARKLFAAAHQPKHFVTIAGADHNDWLTEAYVKELDRFITSTADAPEKSAAP